ncbi:tol-pal system protein YbgF [Motilimonas sp. KMU-193]|uniref:tol-pal system protein YbgF n=1 Tax=Motilimonas sp. KMU-193 TaxID=3388668 RepID=UPI00396B2127
MKTAMLMAVISTSYHAFAAAPVKDVRAAGASGDLETRLATLERMLDARNQMQFDIQQQLNQLQREMNTLTGTIEKQNYKIEQIQTRQRELYQEIDTKLAQPAVVEAEQPSEVEAAAPADEKQAYQAAVNLVLQDKKYDEAISAFKGFIQTYPDSSYSANAHYWLGQLLFNAQQHEAAKVEFDIVATKYADSTKRAEALLKSGIIAEYLGNKSEAISLYQSVISEYPGSASANLAEPRLAALK